MKKIFLMLAVAACSLCSCGSKSSIADSQTAETSTNDSTIILYYSQTGATKAVAEELQKQLGCDIAVIEAVNPYDGDFAATAARWRSELDNNVKVEILPIDINLNNYNTIFLGFPIWGGTYASPIATFLADNPLDGKKIVTFATFGSGGLSTATADVIAALPAAEVTPGYGVRNARIDKAPAEITRFLIENGFISGKIEPRPEYSEATPVTDSDLKLFNDACGNYQFPLGTPVSVASRTTPDGTDYRFDVKSSAPDGSESTSTIYVTVIGNSAPEFTEVVRH